MVGSADPKRVEAGNGVGNIAGLLELLGGNKSTTTSTGDTTALQDVLGQIKGNDPTALLQSLFTQAGGQIPGLQAARANAVGARTGGNSVSGTAIDKLMQDTVLKAQGQIAQQQLASQQLQVQAGGAIASNNQTQQKEAGTNLGKAGTILGISQGLSKLLGSPVGQKLVGKGKGLFDSLTGVDSGADVASSPLNFDIDQLAAQNTLDTPMSFDSMDLSGLGDFLSGGGSAIGDVASSFTDVTLDDPFFDIGFKDGGLVGRDNKRPAQKQGKTTNPDKPGYAEGGAVSVKSAGGRSSSGASYIPNAVTPNTAIQGSDSLLNPRTFAEQLPVDSGSGGTEGNNVGQSTQGLSLGSLGAALGHAAMAMTNPIGFMTSMMDNAVTSQNGKASPIGFQTAAAIATANPIGIAKGLMGLMQSLADPGVNPDGTSSTAPGVTGTSSVADAMNAQADAANAGDSSNSGNNGAGVGEGADSSGEGGGFKSGGKVKGPGTGTSDSIDANLSDGEYVIPADVVQKFGVSFFDSLRTHFHTPAEADVAGI